MKKRYIVLIIFIAIIVSAFSLIISFSIAPRDISWISEIENWVKEENWEPDREYIPLMLEAFFLYENGEEQFFRLYSHQSFTAYIRGLVNDVNRQNGPISRDMLMDEILVKDRVLGLILRFPSDFGFFNEYGAAYFILKDKLDMNLEGTIIICDAQGKYTVWEITNWFL